MKIHGLSLVKNEVDIIEQSLRSAATWCDAIYVLDNGSTDGTWEIVRRLEHELGPVVAFRQDATPYTNELRGRILRHFSSRAEPGDWWCILDADEFPIDDPRGFLSGVPGHHRSVWAQQFNFLFTDADLEVWLREPGRFDDSVPVERRSRHYVLGGYSHLRFFRHDPGLADVPSEGPFPIHPKRIRLRHYMYRSPSQIQKRLETRREPMRRGEFQHEKRGHWVPGEGAGPGPAGEHELAVSWRERVVPVSECLVDLGDGHYPEATEWTPPDSPDGPAWSSWTSGLRSRTRLRLKRLRLAAAQVMEKVRRLRIRWPAEDGRP